MKPLLILVPLALSAALAAPAFAAGVLTDAKGMTLYVFDKDTKSVSTCYDACAKNWPAYLVKGHKETGPGWTMTKRKNGAEQWAYDGKPLYYFYEDKKAGDMKGDGFKGVWHTVNK